MARNEAICAWLAKLLLVEVGVVNLAQIASCAPLRRNDKIAKGSRQSLPAGRSVSDRARGLTAGLHQRDN